MRSVDHVGAVQVYAVDKSPVALAWAKLNVGRMNAAHRVQVQNHRCLCGLLCVGTICKVASADPSKVKEMSVRDSESQQHCQFY